MRRLICRLSGVLCIACVGMVFVAFFTKVENANPMDAGNAMAFWVLWGWVFAILNYATLPKGKPPPVDPAAYWRWLCQAFRALASGFSAPQQQFGLSFWLVIVLIFIVVMSMIAPAVQNARRASPYYAATSAPLNNHGIK